MWNRLSPWDVLPADYLPLIHSPSRLRPRFKGVQKKHEARPTSSSALSPPGPRLPATTGGAKTLSSVLNRDPLRINQESLWPVTRLEGRAEDQMKGLI